MPLHASKINALYGLPIVAYTRDEHHTDWEKGSTRLRAVQNRSPAVSATASMPGLSARGSPLRDAL